MYGTLWDNPREGVFSEINRGSGALLGSNTYPELPGPQHHIASTCCGARRARTPYGQLRTHREMLPAPIPSFPNPKPPHAPYGDGLITCAGLALHNSCAFAGCIQQVSSMQKVAVVVTMAMLDARARALCYFN